MSGKDNRPTQVVLGGEYARVAWERDILPILRTGLSTRKAALHFGISHQTIWRWRQLIKRGTS